jgi:hypothetical protein
MRPPFAPFAPFARLLRKTLLQPFAYKNAKPQTGTDQSLKASVAFSGDAVADSSGATGIAKRRADPLGPLGRCKSAPAVHNLY